jgi:acetylornithine deacetylase
MTIDPFGGELRNGKLWGRGSSDTKGSMAAMIWGLIRNRDRLADLAVAVDFVAFMSEESGQQGSRHFVQKHGADYEFAIAGEPTRLDIVYVTKGSLWATLTASGLSGHSSQPELGDNAIMKLVRSLDLLESELHLDLADFTHPVLGSATINVGMIRGGTRANIIPDQASAQIDIRFPPSLTTKGSAREFLEAFIAGRGLPLTLERCVENPPMEVPVDNEWLTRLTALNPQSRLVGAPWFSDAAHLNEGGLPAICLGPGSIQQAHTRDEFISIADLEAGADYFSRLIAGLEADPTG